MIEAGAAAVHFEDQLSSAKKCGHMGGKVVVPICEFVQKLIAARLAADVWGFPPCWWPARTPNSAGLLLSDIDPRDTPFLTGGRTTEGFFHFRGGIQAAIARGLAYAPYADMLWCETSDPNLDGGADVCRSDPREVPGKAAGVQLLAFVPLEEEAGRCDDRATSSRSWARWATSSSSSRWPGSTR